MAAENLLGPDSKYGTVGEVIGRGGFGVVFKTSKGFALKSIAKKDKSLQKDILNEIVFPMRLKHPNIIKYEEVFYSKAASLFLTGIVMPLFPTDLRQFDLYQRSPTIKFPIVIFKLVSAVAYLHSYGIIHRDIKPENILFDPTNANPVLADFGLSCSRDCISEYSDRAGTVAFMAPEVAILREKFDVAVDIWALAVTILVIMYRSYPFRYDAQIHYIDDVFIKVGLPEEYDLRKRYLRARKDALKDQIDDKLFPSHGRTAPYVKDPILNDMLVRMLNMNPFTRVTAQQLLSHPFVSGFRSGARKSGVYPVIPPTNCLQRISRAKIAYDYNNIKVHKIIPSEDYYKVVTWMMGSFEEGSIAYTVRFLAIEILLRYYIRNPLIYSQDTLEIKAVAATYLAGVFLTPYGSRTIPVDFYVTMFERINRTLVISDMENEARALFRGVRYDIMSSTVGDMLVASIGTIEYKVADLAIELALLGCILVQSYGRVDYHTRCIELAGNILSSDAKRRRLAVTSPFFKQIKYVFENYADNGFFTLQQICPYFYDMSAAPFIVDDVW